MPSLSDAALLTDLGAMFDAVDPVPDGLVEHCRALSESVLADLRAWTVWQPWCSAIVGRPGGDGGPKDVENRPRRTNRRGLVLIHAAREDAYDFAAVTRCVQLRRWLLSQDRPTGWVSSAIVGAAVITGCHQCDGSCSEWAEPGAWHVELGRRFAFPQPVPTPGALGFWRVKGEARDAVLRQLAEVAR